jgi:hypothetical protein
MSNAVLFGFIGNVMISCDIADIIIDFRYSPGYISALQEVFMEGQTGERWRRLCERVAAETTPEPQ